MSLYHLNVTLHLLAALLWLGGMFFLGVVGAPVLRQVEPAALRVALFRDLGLRFRGVGWVAIGILIVTGLGNLAFRGLLHWELLSSARFWATPFGRALAWKLVAVSVMVVASAVHDFILGPAASAARPGTPEADRWRRSAALLARLNALVGLLVVLIAVRLARGG
jgi:putative copper export protein